MSETENRADLKRSLLAYARDEGDHAPLGTGSLLALARDNDDVEGALERHRAARSRREERIRREALAAMDAAAMDAVARDAIAQSPVASASSDPGGRLSGWLSRFRRSGAGLQPATKEDASARSPDAVSVMGSDDVFETVEAGDDRHWKPLIDPMKVIGGIGRSWKLIALCTVLGALLGVAVAVSTPKKYVAAAELLIDPRDLKLVDRDLTQAGFSNEATLAIVENQVRVITSGTVLNRVVDTLHLDEDPEFNGQGGSRGLVSGLRSALSGAKAADDAGRRRALAIDNLAESLSVERGGKTFVVVIAVKTLDGEKSALIANTMADVFLKTYGELQSDTATRATEELTARLSELRDGVEAAERGVETFKAEHDIINPQGRLITDDELVRLNDQLSVARARTLELKAKAASAGSANVGAVVGGELPEALASPIMTELRAQYAATKSEADRLAVKLGPLHPQRQAVDAQLAGAREQISAELRRIAAAARTELARSQQLEQELSSRLAQLKVRQGGVNRDMVVLRELEREAAAKRAVYEAFLLRARETGEQRDINTANMSVISVAYPPLRATGPSRSTIAILGTVLGFLGGVGLGGMRGAYESLSETANPRRRVAVRPVTPPTAMTRPEDDPTEPGGGHPRRPEQGSADRAQPLLRAVPQRVEHSAHAFAPDHAPISAQEIASTWPPAPTTYGDVPQPAAPAAPVNRPSATEPSIDEIRASLRDFRHRVEGLAEARTRRRYF